MKRMIEHHLRLWKEDASRKALLVKGARQVGKTHTLREFGKTFDEFVEINFEMLPQYGQIFEPDLDPQRILRDLRLMTGRAMAPGHCLLFLDEVQGFPKVISSLRYFYELIPEMHVIAAGSLMEFAIESLGIPVGRVAFLHMYPMSFVEFLLAQGDTALAAALSSQTNAFPLANPVHDKLMRKLGEYMVVGGMPEPVALWVEHRDLKRCAQSHTFLREAYRQDFGKYAKKHQVKHVDLIFSHIPLFLGQRFKYSRIPGEFRARELAPALDLLRKAAVIHQVTHSAGNGVPLKAESKPDHFKLLPLDVGMAQSMLGLDVSEWLLNPQASVLNRGAITEAMVGQELIAYSLPWRVAELHYWHRESRGSSAEVDYLVERRGRVLPVEVKSGARGTLRSLRLFLEEKGSACPHGFRFSAHPFSIQEDVHSFPLYAIAAALGEEIPPSWGFS